MKVFTKHKILSKATNPSAYMYTHMQPHTQVYNNNNVHLSFAHQRPERYMIHINLNILYTHVLM